MNTFSIQRPRPSDQDANAGCRQHAGKAELVNWLPGSVLKISLAEVDERLLDRLDAERDVRGVGQPPCQHGPACAVHERQEIQEGVAYRYIDDVSAADQVRPFDRTIAQQIRENLVHRRRPCGAVVRDFGPSTVIRSRSTALALGP